MKTALIAVAIAAMALAGPVWPKGAGGSHSSSSSGRSASSYSSPSGSHAISGYSRRDGTYVAPSHATNPNTTKNDNWTTRPNVNPYTGKPGTRNPEGG